MATDNLRTAGNKRRTTKRKSIADLEKEIKSDSPIEMVATKPITISNSTAINSPIGSITIPGSFEVSTISNSIPSLDLTKYQVANPLNPPETLPTVTQTAFEKGMGIYQGATRALQMQGAAADLAGEKFKVLGKQAKAATAGITAATDYKKAEGAFYDYQSQSEINSQKADNLGLQQHKTVVNKAQVLYEKKVSDEKLEQSRISSELMAGKTQQKQAELDELMKQLSPKLAV